MISKSSYVTFPKKLTKNKSNLSDKKEKDYSEVVFIDNIKNLLKKDEICVVGWDDTWIYVYDEGQFFKAISENFQMSPFSRKILKNDKNCKTEAVILKDKDYVISFEKSGMNSFSYIKDGEPTVAAMVHPIKRSAYITKFTSNRNQGREEIDILPLINAYRKCLGFKDLEERIYETIQAEWDKLHKGKKPDYIV